MRTGYKVRITPRLNDSTYGDAVDVSDQVRIDGLDNVSRGIDASDYDFGIYAFGDFRLKALNHDGYFNDVQDSRSMFPYTRDLAKVEVIFLRDVDVETVTFRGLIDDRGTRLDIKVDTIEFRVLSREAIINKYEVQDGTVQNGSSIKDAIYRILNEDEITKVLTVDYDNINPDLDIDIDDGSVFDGMNKKDAINQLLLVSNSVMVVNDDNEFIVRSRLHDSEVEPIKLYGAGDLKGRENIQDIKNYNLGTQRVFNSIKVNDTLVRDTASILTYGLSKKEITFAWITNPTTESQIANRLLDEFKYAKIEFEVTVATDLVQYSGLLERVSVDYPFRVKPPTGKRLPFFDAAEWDEENTPFPYLTGSVEINPSMGFKIIQIEHDPKKFLSTLKLRQIGTTQSDGFL